MTQNKGLVLDLVDYCEKLEKAGKILPCGYENKIAHYCIHLWVHYKDRILGFRRKAGNSDPDNIC